MRIRAYNHFQANQTQSNSTIIFGKTIEEHISGFPVYAIILIIVAVLSIIVLIVCLYFKKKNRDLYEQTPQNFSKKPQLSFFKKLNYKKSRIITPLGQEFENFQKKTTYEGELFQVKLNRQQDYLLFDHKLTTDSYFEIQILQLYSYLQIGFIPVSNIQQFRNQKYKDLSQVSIDRQGVCLSSEGEVSAYGQKKFNCNWTLKYGDIIGIGFTKHKSSTRVWFTKNGVLINQATQQQMLKNIDLDKQTINDKRQTIKTPQQQERERARVLEQLKRKVEFRRMDKFEYYAVVNSHRKKQEPTIINWNVGAHTFRLYDGNYLKGLLN